jgi:DNA-binding NarL/FixJ family response regulator
MAGAGGITVLLAARDDLVARLQTELASRFELLATLTGLDDAVERAVDLVPDVLVLDDDLDRAGLGERCQQLCAALPATRLLVIVAADDDLAYEAVLQGAFCTLAREATTDDVVNAVRGAARGESVIVPGNAQRLLEDTARVAGRPGALRLTRTEQEVLELIAAGGSPAVIAVHHDVTARLVNLHTGYAIAKVHLHAQRVRAHQARVRQAAPGRS